MIKEKELVSLKNIIDETIKIVVIKFQFLSTCPFNSFFEIELNFIKLNIFKVYNLMGFNMFTTIKPSAQSRD